MSRIKLNVTGNFLGKFNLRVRITDINYGNHTGNDAVVGLMHEARMMWLSAFNYTELNIDGTGLIMSDLAVQFKNESFYGDDLVIEIFADEITSRSFHLYYRITAVRPAVNSVIAIGKTVMICYDYSNKRIAEMPLNLKNILERNQVAS